jgi:16S rRNA (guanine966-N2)-methyltransferase
MSNSHIRIIGGKWRSRKISFPTITNIRPTPDRVRETLFNWLAPNIVGTYCLDLFAGSGALGFEALSRGAAWAGFVEHSYRVAAAIRQQIDLLNTTGQAHVYHTSYINLTTNHIEKMITPNNKINVVFLDPPFKKGMLESILQWLTVQPFLSPQAVIYIEHEKQLILPESITTHWFRLKHQQAGEISYGLWQQRNILG